MSYYSDKKYRHHKSDEHICNSEKHDKHCYDYKKCEKKGKLVDFDYKNLSPIADPNLDDIPIISPLNVQSPFSIAAVTLHNVKKGNAVWLNALYHIDNDTISGTVRTADIVTAIYKNSVAESNLIWRSIVEIDAPEGDDVSQIIAQFVDKITATSPTVTYILTAQLGPQTPNAVAGVAGPITFTASEITF
ncbi:MULTISPECIES: hypothetical protein [Bacillus cereus group]|uniref:Uncharacterized protein n=1 Tax=Bacillus cereus TaxID=1396 RepID=A0AA44QBR7_BACCE|nr:MULTISPECIES: hypothetical protein [Bacillus cereus group]PFA18579.1 hypothetical protein CN373_18760 [Bacillus cereus]PFN08701.1 hypothetical protein COJ55_05635 [Bacillus cereus]PFO84331.1 hypothetical protein COJ77_05855 [Bacillus cereus]PFR26284.1 hypothetical protein COK19_12920 [Bacillus cereus]PFS02240.1 hypothetical protein COK38_09600 [Bacillus cereus]